MNLWLRIAYDAIVMRTTWIALGLAMVGLLAGCNNGGSTSAGTTTTGGSSPTNEKPFKVALLTPGPVSDAGWSALAYEGLKKIESDLGAEVSNLEAAGPKIRDAMRSYAQDGYTLVIGHGYEYNEPGVEVAKDFPDTVFISSSGGGTSTNAGAIRFLLEEGFYVAGYMAGSISKTGKVAMIGGDDVPSIRSTFKGFAAGAKAANPKIQVIEVFTKSGTDVAKAKQATLTAIGQGADVVIHQANAAAQGVFDACKEKKVWAVGSNFNQNENESGRVIGSAIIQPDAFLNVARQVKEGSYKGGVMEQHMKDGAIEFIVNPLHINEISPALAGKLEQLTQDIKDGKVAVPFDKF